MDFGACSWESSRLKPSLSEVCPLTGSVNITNKYSLCWESLSTLFEFGISGWYRVQAVQNVEQYENTIGTLDRKPKQSSHLDRVPVCRPQWLDRDHQAYPFPIPSASRYLYMALKGLRAVVMGKSWLRV